VNIPGDQDYYNGTYAQLTGLTSTSPNPLGLLGVDGSGLLWYYTENERQNAPLSARANVGYGWQIYNSMVKVGDITGDGKPDIIARDSAGKLWLYKGTGTPSAPLASRVQIGTDWQIYNSIVGVGDMTGDGKPDIIARDSAGKLWLYKGTGNASAPYTARVQIGTDWQIYKTIA
jgi:sugar lactone lactonase YvrE